MLGFLREIDRHSRAVRRDGFDRARSAAFVLAFLASPFVVSRMQDIAVSREREDLMLMRVFRMEEGGEIKAQRIDFDDRGSPWRVFMPVGEAMLVGRSAWCGWPLTTRHSVEPTEIELTRLASAPARDRAPAMRAAERLAGASGLAVTAREERTHVAAWVFSAGIWWMLLAAAAVCVIEPVRWTVTIVRRARTAVRQSRIDRCHCPNCGYDAKHSILMGRCPECGSELYERPDRR
ncbi:MAG: hypothetical protein ACKOYN_01985 [Planctomycetota bacterium]